MNKITRRFDEACKKLHIMVDEATITNAMSGEIASIVSRKLADKFIEEFSDEIKELLGTDKFMQMTLIETKNRITEKAVKKFEELVEKKEEEVVKKEEELKEPKKECTNPDCFHGSITFDSRDVREWEPCPECSPKEEGEEADVQS